jgi:hypothetical protein
MKSVRESRLVKSGATYATATIFGDKDAGLQDEFNVTLLY